MLGLAMGLGATPITAPAEDPVLGEVRAAVAAAVEIRLGVPAEVTVEQLRLRATDQMPGELLATPEAGARLGREIRFSLARRDPGSRTRPQLVGVAVAVVSATATHACARHAIERGTILEPADVEEQDGPLGPLPLQRLPRASDLTGARVLRALAAGEVVTLAAVVLRPVVRSGEIVTTRVVVDNVRAEGRAVAAQSGALGQVITVVHPGSRRTVKARVVGPGEVEVIR